MDTTQKLTDFFEKTFDAIFVIFYTGNVDRLDNLKSELSRVGILNCKNLSWYYDVASPYDQIMYNNITLHYPSYDNILPVKKLSMNHYKIAKIAYTLNYKRILILEDDVCFLKDLELLLSIFEKTPIDGDIVLYDKMIFHQNITKESYKTLFNKPYVKYNQFYKEKHIIVSSAALYALSKKGMNEIITCQEKYFCISDFYTNDIIKRSNYNKYAVNINCAIQNTPKYFDTFYDCFIDLNMYNLPNIEYKTNIHDEKETK